MAVEIRYIKSTNPKFCFRIGVLVHPRWQAIFSNAWVQQWCERCVQQQQEKTSATNNHVPWMFIQICCVPLDDDQFNLNSRFITRVCRAASTVKWSTLLEVWEMCLWTRRLGNDSSCHNAASSKKDRHIKKKGKKNKASENLLQPGAKKKNKKLTTESDSEFRAIFDIWKLQCCSRGKIT